MFQIFLESLTFNVSLVREDDGYFTVAVEKLNLFDNAESKNGCLMLLLEDMKEYAQDFCREFDLWSSATNRQKEACPICCKDTFSFG